MLGGHLLTALAEQARPTCNGLCLNVRADNPAVRLYERQGYRHLPGSELVNRTGGLSFGMVLRFR
jgi:ribosomal protein S18 acetylase RimI-like enzyme